VRRIAGSGRDPFASHAPAALALNVMGSEGDSPEHLRQEPHLPKVTGAAQAFIDEAIAAQAVEGSSLESGQIRAAMGSDTLDLAVIVQRFLETHPAPTEYIRTGPRSALPLRDLKPRSRRARKRARAAGRYQREADQLAIEAELLRALRHAEPKQVATVAKQMMSNPDQAAKIEETSRQIRRTGITGLSPGQLLVLVLVWLILPAAQAASPQELKNLIAEEVPVLAVAVAITMYLLGERERKK